MSIRIETSRLILRPFKLADAKSYYNITRDPQIKKYVSYACPDSISEAKESIKSCYSQADFKRDFYFVIEEKKSGNIVGSLSLTQNFFMDYYEICYFISNSYRRKGYMEEVLTNFLESISSKEKIVFVIKDDNIPSLNLIQKLPYMTDISKEYKKYLPSGEKMFCYNKP